MDYIDNYMDSHLSEKRRIHTEGVRGEAVRLAKKYGADPKKADLAACCHDLFRGLRGEALYETVQELGLDLARYGKNPNLAHGKIAACKIKTELQITDEDVLRAVSYHTTGRPGMSTLEKVVFLADAIEPNRDYQGVDELRRLAEESLDAACLLSLTRTAEYVKSQGQYLDEDTLHAIQYFQELENHTWETKN